MTFQPIDDRKDTPAGEFEKLEFLPEPAGPETAADEAPGGELVFLPEDAEPVEPPVSFLPDLPVEAPQFDVPEIPPDDLGLDAGTPFELFGTSLFSDLDPEEDDLDDDLIF